MRRSPGILGSVAQPDVHHRRARLGAPCYSCVRRRPELHRRGRDPAHHSRPVRFRSYQPRQVDRASHQARGRGDGPPRAHSSQVLVARARVVPGRCCCARGYAEGRIRRAGIEAAPDGEECHGSLCARWSRPRRARGGFVEEGGHAACKVSFESCVRCCSSVQSGSLVYGCWITTERRGEGWSLIQSFAATATERPVTVSFKPRMVFCEM